ncbi:DUF58 domain-containing protein, partial [Cellulomonas hominis]|nr:DUF58 domain-containing protein [Cellulomonas hominis]
MRLRPTRRGVGLVVVGLLVSAAGTAFGSTDLLTIGTLPVLLVALGLIGVALVDPGRGRGLRTRRTVQPDPVHVGRTADVQ